MTDVELYEGDCLDIMPNLISRGEIDMVMCDLPYGTTQNAWDTVIPLDRLWAEYWRVIKDNGPAVLTAQSPFDKMLGASCIQHLKYEWIWEKPAATGFLNARVAPLKAHENVLVFYKKAPTYNPQKTSGHLRKQSRSDRSKQQTTTYGRQAGATAYDSTDRYPRTVIRISSDKQTSSLHPTQKPVALMEYLIKTYTNEGDTVLDNCMGSGTTGVACVRTGRRFIGIEQNAEYFAIAEQRIDDEIMKRALGQ